MQASYPVRDLRKYDYVGQFTVTSIHPDGAVILDRPFEGKRGDVLCGDGEYLQVGCKVTAYRDKNADVL